MIEGSGKISIKLESDSVKSRSCPDFLMEGKNRPAFRNLTGKHPCLGCEIWCRNPAATGPYLRFAFIRHVGNK